ncbi:hypothetical protein BJY00DRAFT_257770 [Aspergillus carlsbadensis]|nr:hypothetical protein BJY00DRAFT_257770 [Aspergillus carlsbadensis]
MGIVAPAVKRRRYSSFGQRARWGVDALDAAPPLAATLLLLVLEGCFLLDASEGAMHGIGVVVWEGVWKLGAKRCQSGQPACVDTCSTRFSYCVCLSLEEYSWIRRARLIQFPPINGTVYGILIRRPGAEKGRCSLKTAAGLRLLALASVKDSARFHANAPHHTRPTHL